MKNKVLSRLDNKKFKSTFKLTLIILFIVLIINLVGVTYSRYESKANMNVQANIALFLVDQGTYNGSIALEGLEPSSTPYTYVINVRNYNDTYRTDVDLTYHVKFETTTNLPLNFSVYRNEEYSNNATNIISSSSYRQDGDVYYKVYETNGDYSFHYNSNEQDYYTIVVEYPEAYKNFPDLYQGKIDLITVIITAEQVA